MFPMRFIRELTARLIYYPQQFSVARVTKLKRFFVFLSETFKRPAITTESHNAGAIGRENVTGR